MADKAAVRIKNIISFTHNSNKYIGVRSVAIVTDKGVIAAILKEGDQYVTGSENLGSPGFPVSVAPAFETDDATMLELLAEPVASTVIVYKNSAGGANKTMTIVNAQYWRMSGTQELQKFGQRQVDGGAYSADGSTLPISIA